MRKSLHPQLQAFTHARQNPAARNSGCLLCAASGGAVHDAHACVIIVHLRANPHLSHVHAGRVRGIPPEDLAVTTHCFWGQQSQAASRGARLKEERGGVVNQEPSQAVVTCVELGDVRR